MRILLVTVLAAVLWSGKALSLKCYSCSTHSNSSYCMIPTVCSELDKYCKTTVGTSETGSSSTAHVSKTCAAECTETNHHGVSTSCCQRDFCNRNGAARTWLGIVELAIVVPLASAILWVGP
ncbi:lymphocyte antigen 6E-like [Podarcis raffonei]|uniref:lymphocyte antigen 6E-like n=1 Tax=Podarcis raffonei TaxID=65483 RepID=UPI00232981F8|nr:lymphocyte antigen 6E-like [Podarcis raffonei]